MFGEYISPGRNKKQLQSILGYSVRNTDMRLAFFIVAKNDLKRGGAGRVQYYIMKRLIGFNALGHGVIPGLVNIH